ncbi:MAG: hypothetical protein JWN87_649 [Frankiales bacterium]|jgi:hypothetical protein|nr:hypothetical protein [Frankiales bacterium]
MVHACPICGLRFSYTAELEQHAREEHVPVTVVEREEGIVRYSKNTGRPKLGPVYLPL